MDIVATGCRWRAIPKDLPPGGTPHDYLRRARRRSTSTVP
ncbi:transposase [Rhodovastum atsumiense]|uniref:Transposase n=1 Tax=Rhodovastum atsumiense TaxID=504468 RepID=A0A5M6IZL0_9PROT|nr:transposase [Rhodovastum atsumiense]